MPDPGSASVRLILPWESLTFNWTAGEFHIVAKGPIRRTHLQGGKAARGNEKAKYATIEDRKLVSGSRGRYMASCKS